MEDKHRASFIHKVLRMDSPTTDNESGGGSEGVEKFVLAVDIGTTSLRSHIYNKQGNIKGASSKRIQLLHPQPGWVEMDPDVLVKQVIDSIKESIHAAGITVHDVSCMGITTQRNTFLTWDKTTGKPFHNFITWQDLRSRDIVKCWNSSFRMKALNNGSSVLHMLTRQKRFLSASVLKFMSQQVTMRLIWVLENVEEVKAKLAVQEVCLGCIETWLLYKLTREKLIATDFSCASGTGLFDPYQFEWSNIVCNLLNIPMDILPEIRDTSGDFGSTDPAIFGAAIPITAVVSDQTGALFGECCFEVGDIKCTMGTGTFIDLNCGDTPHASVGGLYPIVGWKIGNEKTFVAEGSITDTGSIMEWAKSLGFVDDIGDTAKIAQSVPDSDGVYFVGAFSGLQAPINDDKAVTTLIGLKPTTTKGHIVRALLENLAFRVKILYETILSETKIPLSHIRADGGVCNNDFLMQLIADFTNQTIDRAKQRANMTSLGAAFLAGLAKGIWKNKSELRDIRESETVFVADKDVWSTYKGRFVQWEKAVHRSREWYS
ncbi:putative glycerol kinase 5 isoform X1 [Ostrea edulis]|uniref:putative glycerol kinase 5 isoform X1 n=2 Tax=Ostrea edulis TaxID=37623 RepID=UPI0024AEB735|nr:putative glycerol kinase 5 isoform X1 [Ostrea edulis]